MAYEASASATLYLRGGVAGTVKRRQDRLRERFEGLDPADGPVETTIERWVSAVVTPVSEAETGSATDLETYRELEAAVERAGGHLEPFFERQPRRGGLLVDRADGERITFPVACLVCRRDEAVTGVYPCWLDGTHHSVEDGLAALAAGDPENLA